MAVDPNDLMTWLGNYIADVMKPYELALEKLNTEQIALKERLGAIERCPAIESDIPYFERPNGGR